jgi:hypothetical protein
MKGNPVIVGIANVKLTNWLLRFDAPELPPIPPGLCQKVFFIRTKDQIVELVYKNKFLDRFIGCGMN